MTQVCPAEIGFVEMSLREGIINIFNQMVDPGSPPLGYKGEMKVLSDKYHGIWLDNEELSNNYVGIVEKMRMLLAPRGRELPAGKVSGKFVKPSIKTLNYLATNQT